MPSILAIAFREYRIRLKNPVLPMWDIFVPLVYLLVFGVSLDRWLGGGLGERLDYPTFFLGGVLGMVTFSIAMNSSYAFFEDLQSGIFYELLTYPFARRDLLFGKLLFNGAFSVLGALLCIAAGITVLGIRVPAAAMPALVLWIALGTAGWYFLFSWISLKIRGFNAYHTTTSGMYLVLMFVSNLFYPTERLPGAVQWFAWANPITWQVDLLRYHIYGSGTPAILRLEAAAFVAFIVVSFVLANRSLNGPIE